MVRSHENCEQSCTTLVEMEAKDHQTQRQTEETTDGEHQGSRRFESRGSTLKEIEQSAELCSRTEESGETSSQTGHRPTRSAVRTASATDGASPPTFTDAGCTVAIIAAPVHTSELS